MNFNCSQHCVGGRVFRPLPVPPKSWSRNGRRCTGLARAPVKFQLFSFVLPTSSSPPSNLYHFGRKPSVTCLLIAPHRPFKICRPEMAVIVGVSTLCMACQTHFPGHLRMSTCQPRSRFETMSVLESTSCAAFCYQIEMGKHAKTFYPGIAVIQSRVLGMNL